MEVITTQERTRYTYVGIFFVSFFIYLLFSHQMPITDPVESNYTLTAKEMVQTSDWLSPRIYGNVWYDKPIFFYWLTALSFKLFGFSDLAARLVPALFAAFGLAFIYWFVRNVSGRLTAFIATMILGTSLEYVILAKLIITDMVFFVFNSTALAFFYLGYSKLPDKKRWYLGMYISLALAVLTKGPVGLLLPGLVILIFIGLQRKWNELKEISIPIGILLFAGIALPWYGAMYVVHGADFLKTFFGVHNYLRATVSEHPKDNVIFYYFIVFFLTMLPWSAVAAKAILRGYKDLRSKTSPLVLFCLIWSSTYFLFYSLMATKYITYIFPILFPISIVTGLYLTQVLSKGDTRTLAYWCGIPSLLLVIGYIVIAKHYLSGFDLAITITSLLAVILFMCWQIKGKETKQIFGLLCFSQISFFIILSMFVFPAITNDRSGKDMSSVIADLKGSTVGMYQFYSTSSVYYTGKVAVKLQQQNEINSEKVESLDWSKKYTMPAQTLDEFVGTNKEHSVIIVPEKMIRKFMYEAKILNPKLINTVDGFSYYTFDAS